jgi:hypothetical protein
LASHNVARLVRGVLKTMFPTKLKIATVALLAVGFGAAGAGALAPRAPAQPPAEPSKGERAAPTTPAEADAALAQPAAVPLIGHKGLVCAVAFSPDGKTVATAGADKRGPGVCADKTVRLWDAATGQELFKREMPGKSVNVGVAFSPDGKMLAASSSGKDGALICWDVEGKELWRNVAPDGGAVAFSPDGRVAASCGRQPAALIDAQTGKPQWGFSTDKPDVATAAAFSPDGKLLAVGLADGLGFGVYLLDASTGKLLRTWPVSPGAVQSLWFLSGGGKIAAADEGGAVRLLDASTGKEEAAFKGVGVRRLALSADGKRAATTGYTEVVVWDMATGTEERRFAAAEAAEKVTEEAAINALAFAPNGERLATACGDGTAVVWDLTEKLLPADFKLTEKELPSLWDELASAEGGEAYASLRMLRADPARSVPFLQARLQPRADGPDDKKIKRLIADLDSDDFDVRERATKALEQLGKDAESALREALAGSPDPEVQVRAERLLNGIGEGALTAEQKRDVRAVRVLEQAGTPEARALLEALTKESPGWWATQEAKAALQRMDRRGKKP